MVKEAMTETANSTNLSLSIEDIQNVTMPTNPDAECSKEGESTSCSSVDVLETEIEAEIRIIEVPGQEVIPVEFPGEENPTVDLAEETKSSEEDSSQEKAQSNNNEPQTLFCKQTLRGGQSINHNSNVVILGDVNPGAEVVADGDIIVWGALRGIAHAGRSGDTTSEIRALRIQAVQLRIANTIARAPDNPKRNGQFVPETARIIDGQIKVVASVPE